MKMIGWESAKALIMGAIISAASTYFVCAQLISVAH